LRRSSQHSAPEYRRRSSQINADQEFSHEFRERTRINQIKIRLLRVD
jgi:hypothetical protein